MGEKRQKPWWLQVNGLPPKAAARRDALRAARAGMTRAQRADFEANRSRRWVASHWWPVVIGLALVSLVQVVTLRGALTGVDGVAALFVAVQRFFYAGVTGRWWARCAEARFLRV